MRDEDHAPVSAAEAKALFAPWKDAAALLIAVSGGPDSVALMWLAARWRRSLPRGPRLLAVTVDHGLRPEAAREARDVKELARALEIAHRTMKWTGAKPDTGVPAAARAARYRLLARAARGEGATHILTGHTLDDQAETVLMRLLRGSGIAGLSAMAHETGRAGVILVRPLLAVPKSRLVATLKRAGIGYADDPTNRDTAFTRPRLRALLPLLAAEGGDASGLARLAARLARANAAIEVLTDGAERYLALTGRAAPRGLAREFDIGAFTALPEEIRLRLLMRAINTFGHEGPAELGKVEALLMQLDRCFTEKSPKGRPRAAQIRLKQTLAGALVSVSEGKGGQGKGQGKIRIEPAPPRRRR
jgi:tRNA(Ile)-lysidine synthase